MNRIFIIFLIFILGVLVLNLEAEIYKRVKVQELYLRAGPNRNFEVLKKLKKGDILEFVEEKYGWTRVVLPEDVPLYIYRQMVAVSGNRAIVVKNRVNVRARPNLNSTVVGQVNKGNILTVIGMEADWIKIRPPSGFTGWVKSEYVEKCEYIPIIKSQENKEKKEEIVVIEDQQEMESPEGKEESGLQQPEPRYQIFTGEISEVGKILGRKSRYKLKTDEGIYYLRGDENLIFKYLGTEVTIEGEKVDEDLIYLHNVIDADN
jgi:SH3-like domain-containing protein